MPNFFSAFTSEVFRPLVTLLIPGAIGISTWFIALLWRFPRLKLLADGNHTEVGLLLLLAMTFAGLWFEDLGSQFENWLDGMADNDHRENWFAYLRTAFEADPIGRRYIRTLVLRLKFELGVAWAMLCAAVGLFWLASLGLDCTLVLVNLLICLGFAGLGFKEAMITHKALSKNRANLLLDIRIVSKGQNAVGTSTARQRPPE